ncbi:MAG: nucleotidyltransferase domain-containing protein [Bacteroidetes bacterium]|nr:nucleotidyltransferase domain-containing protein [Bacteroidota bacterium]
MSTEQIIKELTIQLDKPGIDKVILFGSQAKGLAAEGSDIDLIVVTTDDEIPDSFRKKMEIHHRVNSYIESLRPKAPIDLIVYTKGMFIKMLALNGLFAKELNQNSIVLYERSDKTFA